MAQENFTDDSNLTMKNLNLDEIKLHLSKGQKQAYGVHQIEAGGRSLFSLLRETKT